MDISEVKSLSDLADFLDVLDNDNVAEGGIGFDMKNTYRSRLSTKHPCGSACCIGGWAARAEMLSSENSPIGILGAIMSLRPNVTRRQADRICLPLVFEAYNATPQQGAEVLRFVADNSKCSPDDITDAWARTMGVKRNN